MAFTKEQKQKIIEDLKEKVARQKAMILVGITGFKVKDLNELRKKLKAAEGNIQVAKKTLIEIVFKEKKIDFDKNKFKEEIALVFEATQENENLKILAGYIENEFKTGEEIITLAQLPTREELLAKLVGSISNPISGLVNVLQGNIKGLLQVLAKAKT
jgi:large subunit ribosomal protein L10